MNNEIIKLSPFSHLRLKTEMYFGSRVPHTQEIILYEDFKPVLKEVTWVPALYTMFREILDNASDEVLGFGKGSNIWVEFNPETMIFSIEDDGRGIPIDYDDNEQMHKATMALSQIMTGRNFGERGEIAGTNGIGASGVNFCSEWFKLEIHRDKKKFTQEFNEGVVILGDELVIKKPVITTKVSDKTGTKITFKPSNYVFETVPKLENNFILPEEFIKSRVIELAITNPTVKVHYNGEKINVRNRPEQSLFKDECITIEIKEENFTSKFLLVPNWLKDGEFNHSVINNIPAFNGGSHFDAFKRTFYKNLIISLEKESKKRKLVLQSQDIYNGLLVYNITKMFAPNFDSQSKTRLINENAATFVKKHLENEQLYKDIIKKNKEWIDQIYDRCAIRTNKKDIDDLQKLNKKISKIKVPRLLDANGKDRSKCILLLAEGLSAISGMAEVRDDQIHGGMGLKGKVLNTTGENIKTIMSNKEIVDIMNSIGLQIGVKANRMHLRYGKVFLAHDMDQDGYNIGALLINFFYNFWPELFNPKEEPFIYIFQTPFLIGEKGKERKYWYATNIDEYSAEKYKEYKITRAKGLGSLTKEDWKHSITKPEVTPIIDDNEMKETLDKIFNEHRADDRKKWMAI